MARFDLVIFDCDGVVVDSERAVFEVFGSFTPSLGVDLTEAETSALQPLGYYEPTIRSTLQRTGDPWLAHYEVDTGASTVVGSVEIADRVRISGLSRVDRIPERAHSCAGTRRRLCA
jgi:hypothetical protein